MVSKLLVLLAVVGAARGVDYYQTLGDEYDARGASAEALRPLLDCLSDTGPCSTLGDDYRQYYPEVIYQACARCKPVQKRSMCRFFKRAREVLPERYDILKQKYDPQGIYFDKFIASLADC